MFETAELGQKLSKSEFSRQVPELRQRLLEAQIRLREAAETPVILLFSGVDGAGKGGSANMLHEWMDPRWLVTRAFGEPSQEEAERPEFWRFWRDLPPRGQIGLFLSAWYSAPLLDRVHDRITDAELDDRLERIVAFERTLALDGAVLLKLWMHLGRKAQRKRLESLESDPLHKWRVTKRDWKHWRMYDRFVSVAERIISRTSTGLAPWRIVEGEDERYRSVRVANLLLAAMERRLETSSPTDAARPASAVEEVVAEPAAGAWAKTVLDGLDMGRAVEKKDYARKLEKLQGRLNLLHRKARDRKISTVLVFEGWDAAGKGGAIRRVAAALDARDYEVIPVAAPTDEERAHHYLWRFWRHLPRAGRFMLYDRSWYGRVLVERVEGFAAEQEWRRAYAEINDFERQLVEHGIVLLKFWVHITEDEQARRFEARRNTPYKSWKLTEEDWRNREKWGAYAVAVHDMVERTSTEVAPWVLVEGNDKRYARIKVLKSVCDALEEALG